MKTRQKCALTVDLILTAVKRRCGKKFTSRLDWSLCGSHQTASNRQPCHRKVTRLRLEWPHSAPTHALSWTAPLFHLSAV